MYSNRFDCLSLVSKAKTINLPIGFTYSGINSHLSFPLDESHTVLLFVQVYALALRDSRQLQSTPLVQS